MAPYTHSQGLGAPPLDRRHAALGPLHVREAPAGAHRPGGDEGEDYEVWNCIWIDSYLVKWLEPQRAETAGASSSSSSSGESEGEGDGMEGAGGATAPRRGPRGDAREGSKQGGGDPIARMQQVAVAHAVRALILLVGRMDDLLLREGKREARRGVKEPRTEYDHCVGKDCGCKESAICDGCRQVWGLWGKCSCYQDYYASLQGKKRPPQQGQRQGQEDEEDEQRSPGGKGKAGGSVGDEAAAVETPYSTQADGRLFFCPICDHSKELIQAVQSNDLERIIHLVWVLHASTLWAPGILPPPVPEGEDGAGAGGVGKKRATTARRAAVKGLPSLPPPRRSRDAHVTALHLAAQTANYEAARVLLSGCSAVPPLFFRLIFDAARTPCANPVAAVPPDPKLRHLRLLMQWNLFGEEGGFQEEHGRPPPPHDDFTGGAELSPIPWVNTWDDEAPPSNFLYIRRPVPARDVEVNWLKPPGACHGCGGPEGCINGGLLGCNHDRAWTINNSGSGPPLHACNHLCECAQPPARFPASIRSLDQYRKPVPPLVCENDFEELGPRFRLELFKTARYGWGIRAAEPIPKNAFVAVYASKVVLSSQEAEEGSEYSFEVPRSTTHPDGKLYGGFARFFNHACRGQTLLRFEYQPPHGDRGRDPRILFLAKRDIAPGEELTFHYKSKAFKKDGCWCKDCSKGGGAAGRGKKEK